MDDGDVEMVAERPVPKRKARKPTNAAAEKTLSPEKQD